MDRMKEIERIQKMLDEAQASMTNCTSTTDRKNEAAVIKELYAALKNLEELNLQEIKDRNEEQIEKEKVLKDEAIKKEANDISREKNKIDEKRLSNEELVRDLEDRRDYQRIEIERQRLEAERKRNELEAKVRKYELILKAAGTAAGVVTFIGGCAVAAVATNEGAYDNSVMRLVGNIPSKMVEGFFRK